MPLTWLCRHCNFPNIGRSVLNQTPCLSCMHPAFSRCRTPSSTNPSHQSRILPLLLQSPPTRTVQARCTSRGAQRQVKFRPQEVRGSAKRSKVASKDVKRKKVGGIQGCRGVVNEGVGWGDIKASTKNNVQEGTSTQRRIGGGGIQGCRGVLEEGTGWETGGNSGVKFKEGKGKERGGRCVVM
jgi:hypothetical protein